MMGHLRYIEKCDKMVVIESGSPKRGGEPHSLGYLISRTGEDAGPRGAHFVYGTGAPLSIRLPSSWYAPRIWEGTVRRPMVSTHSQILLTRYGQKHVTMEVSLSRAEPSN